MARSTGTARARLLGSALRRVYEERKITLRELESRTHIPNSTLSRMFNGDRDVKLEQAVAILDALGVEGDARDAILARAEEEDHGRRWWPIGVPDPAVHLAAMLEFDRIVTDLVEVSMTIIPGLLQSADYARAIIGPESPRAEVEQRVAVRMGRREMLSRRDPVQLTAVIGEAALHNEVGGAEVMNDQLAHLVKMAEVVDLRIVPTDVGYHAGLATPIFSVLHFRDATPLIRIELRESGLYLDEDRFVDSYEAAAREVLDKALSREMSVMKVTELLAGRMENT